MDNVLLFLFILLTPLALILTVCWVVYEYRTAKFLKAHQTEWDRRKRVLEARGMREIDIDDAYMYYCDQLMKSRGYCGACLPKR